MTEKEEVGKSLVFPIQGHDTCPHCGCEERIYQSQIKTMKENGEMDKELFPKGPVEARPLFDQSKPIMVSQLSITNPKIPIMMEYYDICANPKCLEKYTTSIELIWQEIQIPKAPLNLGRGGQQLPPGFPFGQR